MCPNTFLNLKWSGKIDIEKRKTKQNQTNPNQNKQTNKEKNSNPPKEEVTIGTHQKKPIAKLSLLVNLIQTTANHMFCRNQRILSSVVVTRSYHNI